MKFEKEIKELEDKLDALKKAAQEPKPWEPKGGSCYANSQGSCGSCLSSESLRLAGSLFKTRESAELGNKVFTFYRRLYQLAIELNPSGKPVRKYEVWPDDNGRFKLNYGACSLAALFETKESGKEAAAIMSRDGWEWPL